MKYRWRDLAFDVDDGLQDQTLVLLASEGPDGPGGEPAFTLCVSDDEAPAGLTAYVDEVLGELSSSLSGFRLGSRSSKTLLADKKAIFIEAHTLSPEGIPLLQKQAFVERGDQPGSVVVVTGACRAGQAPQALMSAAFERLISSLTVEQAGA